MGVPETHLRALDLCLRKLALRTCNASLRRVKQCFRTKLKALEVRLFLSLTAPSSFVAAVLARE